MVAVAEVVDDETLLDRDFALGPSCRMAIIQEKIRGMSSYWVRLVLDLPTAD
jgi:hypothetical protein